jgi:hypothetical protein
MDRDLLAVVLMAAAVVPGACAYLFKRPRRGSDAPRNLDPTKLMREVILEAAEAELRRVTALVLVEQSGREAAEAERSAIETAARERIAAIETVARERIDAAYVAAHCQYTRLLGGAVAAVCAELQRDEQSIRELVWANWRVLRDYSPGLPPPEPPKLASADARPPPPTPPNLPPETVPDTKPERTAPAAASTAVRPPDGPLERSAEDEARIVTRLAALVAEARDRGHAAEHCHKSDSCTGDNRCGCGCDPCLGWQGLREQAEREVMEAQVRAAHLVRPDGSTTHGLREVVGAAPPTAGGGVEPKQATASSPTLVSLTAAVAAGLDHASSEVGIEGPKR